MNKNMIKVLFTIIAILMIGNIEIIGQTKRQVKSKQLPQTVVKEESTNVENREASNELYSFMSSLLNNAFVIIRQDYQLIDEEEGYIKETPGKDYWGRGYSLGARIGDSEFLISGEALRPWSKDGLSKNSRYQPSISNTAIREIGELEFEMLDFDSDAATEVREKRLYTINGSEVPGLSLTGILGHTNGYAVWAVPNAAITEDADLCSVDLKIAPMSINLIENRGIYDCQSPDDDTAIGGFYIVPVKSHPGCVDFCIVGMFQKIGGVWKLVSVTDGTDMKASVSINTVTNIMDGLQLGVEDFLCEIGLK